MEDVAVNRSFWRGKRVLVTGHTGFKGSWLSLWLQELGATITGYALAPGPFPNLFTLSQVGRGMRSVTGDVRDAALLEHTLAACAPEIVIHMAAQPLVRQSYEQPAETYAVNVMGTVNLLEAVRRTAGVTAVVNVTTDKCYENREWIWPYREDEPLGGYDPYSSSKACAEIVTAAYRRSFFGGAAGPSVATARAGNVIGGGDWALDRLVPDLLAAFEAGKPARLRNPHAVRPWQHVLEPLRGYLMLAEQLHTRGVAYAQAWNFGPLPQDVQRVDWVAQRLAQLWGGDATCGAAADDGGHEAAFLALDISKARHQLGWQPVLSLNESLDWVVHWARRRLAGDDARALCLEQIGAYEARAAQAAMQ